MAEDSSGDEYVASDDGSRDPDSESEGSSPAPHTQSRRAHSTQLRSGENDATQERPISHSRGLVDEPNEMVESSEGQSRQRKSRSRQSSKGQAGKSQRKQSRSAQSQRSVDALLTKEYRVILGDMIDGANSHVSNPSLQSSQIGLSIWTASEKLALLQHTSRHGHADLLSLFEAVPTKSEAEIRNFISLLFERTAFAPKESEVPFKETPIAFEISPGCEANLDVAADALAAKFEHHQHTLEHNKFGDQWLIDETIADSEDEEYQNRSNAEAVNAALGAHAVTKSQDADGLTSSDISSLLRPAAFLQLSRALFMNNGEHEHLNWHYIEPITDASETPAIHRSALNDLQTIVVNLTRRLVQVCIFQASTRLRAGDSSRTDWTPTPAVREMDVHLAMQNVGMNKSWRQYWANVANRNRVAVYSDSKKYKDGRQGTKIGFKLTAGEVREEISPGSPNILRSVEEDSDVLDQDLEGLNEDDDLFTDADTNASSGEELSSPGNTSRPSSRKRKRALSPDSLDRRDDEYLEALDQIASAREEDRMYTALHIEPPSTTEPIAPEQQTSKAREATLTAYWRNAVDYESDWEHPLGFPGEASFNEMKSQGAANKRRKLHLAQKLRSTIRGSKGLGSLAATLCSVTLLARPAYSSYAFYVGKDLTADGSVMVGGTGEEVSSHWLQIFPAKDHSPNDTITVGVTEDAVLPGELIQIPQANHTFRYMSMEYSDFEGFPAPLTNGGLNEKGVTVRDVWVDSRTELVEMTPTPQRGLQYSDLARIVLERASTAREGVEIIGDMIAKYGYADYGGNSHLIADKDEGWVVLELSGGVGLWAAERLGSDAVRVLYPGYIENFPTDYASNSTNYLGSPNLVSFAVEQGWWSSNATEPFNIFKVYGIQGNYTARDGGFKYMSQAVLEEATRAMAPLTEQKLIERVRDFRISDDEAGYGQIVSLREGMDADLLRIWNAPTSSVTAPFVPWWLGVDSVPAEYGEHRYLTTGASSSFLNPDFQFQEASHFAGRTFKQVLYYTCSDPKAYLAIVQDVLVGLENSSRSDVELYEKAASLLIEAGDRAGAKRLLTSYSHNRAAEALAAGRTLVDALDSYVKLTGRYRSPVGTQINDAGEGDETVNCFVGVDPDQPAWKQPQTPMRRRRRNAALGRSQQMVA